jgi:hypothetical protein
MTRRERSRLGTIAEAKLLEHMSHVGLDRCLADHEPLGPRTPVGPDSDAFAHAMEVERAWEEHFRDRPVVTLCPYIVGGLDAPAALGRLTGLGAGHDGVLVPAEQGLELFRPAPALDDS